MKIERLPSYAQEFTPFSKQYFLNGNGELEELPTLRNDQEAIDSALDTSLDAILDKFTKGELQPPSYRPTWTDDVDEYVNNRLCVDDLVNAEAAFENAAAELGIEYTSKKEVMDALNARINDKLLELSKKNDPPKPNEPTKGSEPNAQGNEPKSE